MAIQFLNSTEYPNNSRVISGSVIIKRDDVSLYADTSAAPVNIFLLQIPNGKWNTEYIIYVKDIGLNAATNNITILAPTGFLINNAPTYTMNINGETAEITISSNTDYLAVSGSGSTPGLTQIVIARTAFVAKNGNDASALIERLDKPFLTIAAAKNALIAAESTYYTNPTPGLWLSQVSSNDRLCIKVFSGDYQETIFFTNYIDYDLTDAVINAPETITDNGIAADCIVMGNAIINGSMLIASAGTSLRIDADSLIGGTVVSTVEIIGGTTIINAKTISNNSNTVATVSTVNSGAKVIVNNARILNNGNGVCIDGLNTSKLIINNCTLITPGTYSASGTIFVYGACQTNKPAISGQTTAVLRVSNIIFDPNVN